jgi:ABC-2 type transport system ATP-binding protein
VFLDEMTTGLDPSSRRVAWDLIRRIRDGGATVILVTHFMDEAENLCDRVAVIDQKRVIAVDTPDGLVDTYAPNAVVAFSTDEADLGFLERIDEVDEVQRFGRRVSVTGRGPLLARVAAALVGHGIVPTDLQVKRADLEDVFLQLTRGDD